MGITLKAKVVRTDDYIEFQSSDDQGDYLIRIFKDGRQLQMETENGDNSNYINTNIQELTAIRDCISEVIDGKTKKNLPEQTGPCGYCNDPECTSDHK